MNNHSPIYSLPFHRRINTKKHFRSLQQEAPKAPLSHVIQTRTTNSISQYSLSQPQEETNIIAVFTHLN